MFSPFLSRRTNWHRADSKGNCLQWIVAATVHCYHRRGKILLDSLIPFTVTCPFRCYSYIIIHTVINLAVCIETAVSYDISSHACHCSRDVCKLWLQILLSLHFACVYVLVYVHQYIMYRRPLFKPC